MHNLLLFIGLVLMGIYADRFQHFRRTLGGRVLLLASTVYLAHVNPVAGLVAAVAAAQVLREPALHEVYIEPSDRMHLEALMQAKRSADFPAVHFAQFPLQNPDVSYTLF
jgi:hypothetical protein